MEHRFGGKWTDIKLSCLEQYLIAYRNIFVANTRARYFTTWFVDAFAGTGTRASGQRASNLGLFDDVYEDADTVQYRNGSARIALGLPRPFDRYLFIEKSSKRLDALQAETKTNHSEIMDRCSFRQGDANGLLQKWCAERDWRKERAVVFLDPYGMQARWSTIHTIAATKGIDLWYLFPLGMGVSRMLQAEGNIDPVWQKSIDEVLGTTSWRQEFYRPASQQELFASNEDRIERTADSLQIQEFIERRLREIFEAVAKGMILSNSKNYPMYLLCFAAGNKKGAPTALRIAQSLLRKLSEAHGIIAC